MIGLMVRCKDEPYVNEFVRYYLSQGIDMIHILDDDSNDIYREVCQNPKVVVSFGKDIIQKGAVNEFYKTIRHKYEWLLFVDMDEYITAKKTIREELETTFRNCHCVKVPWVMMACNSVQKNPESLLQTNIYRMNHDLQHVGEGKFRCRYAAIEVKCIFKPRFFENVTDHHPVQPTGVVRVVESVRNTPHPLNPFYPNLREKDIEEGHLLCYHYRIVSVENCANKIKTNVWYKNYKLADLMANDYPEIKDETLKNK